MRKRTDSGCRCWGPRQGRKELESLLKRVLAARAARDWGGLPPPPLLLKVAPDLTVEDLKDVAAVALRLKIDGLVVSNTTARRDSPNSPDSPASPPHLLPSPFLPFPGLVWVCGSRVSSLLASHN